MNAPSNANTSGLEVVRLEAQSGGPSGSWFLINDPDDLAFWEEQGYPVRSLVTAASAQARIDALEEAGRLLAAKAEHAINEGFQHIARATAAEARADRLAKALEGILNECPATCETGPAHSMADIARAAVSAERYDENSHLDLIHAPSLATYIGKTLASYVSGNRMPEISGDNRKRIPDHIRARYDRDCEQLAEEVLRYITKAAPASPLPGGGWQDISTAPKNGTEVLVMLKPKVIRLGWYFKPSSRTEGWCDENGKRIIPSHWMPLPAAPTGDA